jgi:hypothetical protein
MACTCYFLEITDSVKFPCLTNVFLDCKLLLHPKPVYVGFVVDNVALKQVLGAFVLVSKSAY